MSDNVNAVEPNLGILIDAETISEAMGVCSDVARAAIARGDLTKEDICRFRKHVQAFDDRGCGSMVILAMAWLAVEWLGLHRQIIEEMNAPFKPSKP